VNSLGENWLIFFGSCSIFSDIKWQLLPGCWRSKSGIGPFQRLRSTLEARGRLEAARRKTALLDRKVRTRYVTFPRKLTMTEQQTKRLYEQ
jgi:hypothetical protein